MKLITKVKKLLNLGVNNVISEYDKKITYYLNIVCVLNVLLIIPVVLITNYNVKGYLELILIALFIALFLAAFILNIKGNSQTSLKFLSIGITAISFGVVNISTTQTAIPFGLLITGLSVILLIKKAVWKYSIFTLIFLSYSYLNFIHITEKKFDTIEYFIALLLLMLFAIVIDFSAKKRNVFEKKIIKQNRSLKDQKLIIESQTRELITLQEKNFSEKMLSEQKRNESIQNNNLIQIRLKHDLVYELKMILERQTYEADLKSTITKLKQEIELQKKSNLFAGDSESLNTEFFHKLQLKHPKITRTDKEYCIYIKLSLSSKEIALIKNTSVNTVNVSKTRLRKKLGLNNNQEVLPYLLTFN